MGQRNMLDQQALPHVSPEPSVLLGTVESSQQPSVHTILPAGGNNGNYDIRHAPDSHENVVFYGMAQYNGFQHHHPARTVTMGSTASNYYDPFITPGTRALPLPFNQGPYNQMPSSSNGGLIAVPTNDYARNHHFVDFKGKVTDRVPGSFPYYNGAASSSSAIAPLNMRPMESGVNLVNASIPLPDYRGTGLPSVMEGGTYRSMPNLSGAIGPDPVSAHNPFQLVQPSYQGQAFPPATSPWLDAQYSNTGGDGAPFTWSHAPSMTYLHGNNIGGGGPEPVNMGGAGYHESAAVRSFPNFVHLPPAHHQANLNFHYPPPPLVQGVRPHNSNFHLQVATASQRISSDAAAQTIVNPAPDNVELGPRFVGPVPPTGLRIYQPHQSQRALVPEANMRHRNLPHLRFLPVEEVAMLDISGYYEVANSVDHHRDLRLDVDHMSYEELLALGEQIGTVTTGLSEETITNHLKSKMYSSSNSMNQEDAGGDQEADFCVICQNDYKNEETVGGLDCGHEYHVDCVKRWLLIKNTCPICKSPALVPERNHQQPCREG